MYSYVILLHHVNKKDLQVIFDDYIKDGISIKWYVDKLQNYFCRQWVVKKDNNAAKKGELIRPYNKLKKNYPSYVNMERILKQSEGLVTYSIKFNFNL